jgi:hypothetical protein
MRTLELSLSFLVALLVLLTFASPVGSQTAVPMLINYQGELRDPSTGDPLEGTYEIVFRIYNDPTDTSPTALVWNESHSGVEVEDGKFSVILGSAAALSAADFSGPDRWLEMQVGGETLSPRQRMTSAAYSIVSEDSRLLGGKQASEFAGSTHAHSGSDITSGTVTEARIDPAISRDSERDAAIAAHAAISNAHHARYTDPEAVAAMGVKANTNPLNHDKTTTFSELTGAATDAQIPAAIARDTEVDSKITTHAAIADAHHARYTDSEAVLAMGAKSDANPLNHDKTTTLPWSQITSIPAGFADGVDDDAGGDITGVIAGTGLTGGGTTGDVTLSAAFGGSGSATTVARSDHNHDASYWKLVGNGGTSPGVNFLGTVDNQALQLHVNNARALRLEPDATSPNVIGGQAGNTVAAGVHGAAIGGGGEAGANNRVSDHYGTVGGGIYNRAGDDDGDPGNMLYTTIGGGQSNLARGYLATIGGGFGNEAADRGTVSGGERNLATGSHSAIGGGDSNTASAQMATVGGGIGNTASGEDATVGGGLGNAASGLATSVSGGLGNTAIGEYATIAGGLTNSAESQDATVGGGKNNIASARDSTVGGGYWNFSGGDFATVGGGSWNEASAEYATIAGGGPSDLENPSTTNNRVTDKYGTIGGGGGNQAGDGAGTTDDAMCATVAGGYHNTASKSCATVGGGDYNTARGMDATVAGGSENTASEYCATVGGGYYNTARGMDATVAGGSENTVSGDGATVAGGYRNVASGRDATVGGGYYNAASGDDATVGGGRCNEAKAEYATIAGGGPSDPSHEWDTNNRVFDRYGTIGGGGYNRAGSDDANPASDSFATVGGGWQNSASGPYGAVGGGRWNIASGLTATVPGGNANTAGADYSFAAGRRARANHQGAFVWGDSQDADISSANNDEVIFRCGGGVFFTSGSGGANQTVSWQPGNSLWSFSSDRNLKESFVEIDSREVLERVSRLPITEWNFKGYALRHIGPVAQDFYSLFPLGGTETTIDSADLQGVALAAIQGLHELLREKDERISTLEARVTALESLVNKLVQSQNGGGQ